MQKPIISVVLGTYNRLEFLKLTIESIRNECHNLAHEIIIVDGGSTDGTMSWLCKQKDIITIIQHNRGEWNCKQIERRSWGYFMNLTFKVAQGTYVCMVSDDCILVPGALHNGINHFISIKNQGIHLGALAFWWREWPQEKLYHIGCTFSNKLYVNHGMYLRSALEAVNYIDEENYFFYNADGDLCLKLWQAGYQVFDSPDSYIEHYPHANIEVRKTNYAQFNQDLKNYCAKWKDIYYDSTLNNLGKIIEKSYDDPNQTALKLQQLHNGVVQKNPEILKGKSLIKRLQNKISWKYKAAIRKINQKFSTWR